MRGLPLTKFGKLRIPVLVVFSVGMGLAIGFAFDHISLWNNSLAFPELCLVAMLIFFSVCLLIAKSKGQAVDFKRARQYVWGRPAYKNAFVWYSSTMMASTRFANDIDGRQNLDHAILRASGLFLIYLSASAFVISMLNWSQPNALEKS
jgi:hypothetical protein